MHRSTISFRSIHVSNPSRILIATVLAMATTLPAHAQKVRPTSEIAPTYNDADKKKLAEIEQRPEIKEAIQEKWDLKRKNDIEYIYNVNTSSRFADISGPQFAEFREKYGQLYNNPMLQRYINAIGQRLVPKDSPNLYSFKLILDPIPKAEALSTGTVVISTGMVATLDNEAQLAYVLGHEIAHIERTHAYDITRMSVLEPALYAEKEKDLEKKKAFFTMATSIAGGAIGGIAKGAGGAIFGAALGYAGSSIASNFLFRDHTTVTEWSDVYENEADEASLTYMLNQNYDAREAPRLFARIESLSARDPRVGLGFVAKPSRTKARTAHIQTVLNGDGMKLAIKAKLDAGGLTGSTGDFSLIMAALKRDNGIVAIDSDLFAMARDNLEEAVSLRSNDAKAQLYLGKVISLTARDEKDRQEAESHFLKAIEYDAPRGAYAEPHLEHALHLLGEHGDKAEITKEIEAYVALYQRQNSGAVPNNISILYDYLTLSGDTNWYATPAIVISTRNAEALRVNTSASPVALTGPQVILAATGSTTTPGSTGVQTQTVSDTPATPAKKPAVRKVSAPK
jgi:Zn-dependent protease with chaperone function